MDKLILWELDIQISCNFGYRSEDKLQVDLEEGSLLEHGSSFLPEKKHLPEPHSVLVDLLEEFTVFKARELVVRQLLLTVRVLFVE